MYGALESYEGKPAKYQLERVEVLRRELAEVARTVADIVAKDARALDEELKQHKLKPMPALSEISPRPSLDRARDRMRRVARRGLRR